MLLKDKCCGELLNCVKCSDDTYNHVCVVCDKVLECDCPEVLIDYYEGKHYTDSTGPR